MWSTFHVANTIHCLLPIVGVFYCCGRYYDNYGNLSLLKQVTLLPKLSNCNIVETKCGNSHSFFISEGYECVYASGHNTHGECGVTWEKKHDPTKLEGIEGKQLKMVTPGAYHTVFVTVDNCVYTCGYCAFGSLGQGYQSQRSLVPVRVDHPDLGFGSKKIRSVECGYWHSIVVTEDGSAYSWGYNRHGECGLNSVSRDGIQSPTLVTGLLDHEKLVDARCGSRLQCFGQGLTTFMVVVIIIKVPWDCFLLVINQLCLRFLCQLELFSITLVEKTSLCLRQRRVSFYVVIESRRHLCHPTIKIAD